MIIYRRQKGVFVGFINALLFCVSLVDITAWSRANPLLLIFDLIGTYFQYIFLQMVISICKYRPTQLDQNILMYLHNNISIFSSKQVATMEISNFDIWRNYDICYNQQFKIHKIIIILTNKLTHLRQLCATPRVWAYDVTVPTESWLNRGATMKPFYGAQKALLTKLVHSSAQPNGRNYYMHGKPMTRLDSSLSN